MVFCSHAGLEHGHYYDQPVFLVGHRNRAGARDLVDQAAVRTHLPIEDLGAIAKDVAYETGVSANLIAVVHHQHRVVRLKSQQEVLGG